MRIYPYSAIPHRLSDAGDRDINIKRFLLFAKLYKVSDEFNPYLINLIFVKVIK
jgi:hypothetical protein